MAKAPLKFYFDIQTNDLVKADGNPIADSAKETPQIMVGQENFLTNLQLYDGDSDTNYTQLPSDCTAQWFTDSDYSNPTYSDFLVGSSNWTLSGSGTNEYYYSETLAEPESIVESLTVLSVGSLGSLSAGEWAFGDNDTIGEDRVYVRLTDSTDPDLLDSGDLRYSATTGYTALFLQHFASDFNQANSWFDSTTQSFRNPDITDGEITFYLNSKTDNFISRMGSSSSVTDTFTEIQFIENSTDEIFKIIKFNFYCYNRLLANALATSEDVSSYYNKTEIDALMPSKIADNPETLTDNATNDINLCSKSTYKSVKISGSYWKAAGEINSFDGWVHHDGTNAYSDIKISPFNTAATPPSYISGVTRPFTADISGDTLRLKIICASVGENLTLKYKINCLVEA